jgi:hypothetical protein
MLKVLHEQYNPTAPHLLTSRLLIGAYMSQRGIDYFYRGHVLSSLQERVSFHARRKMFRGWEAFAKPAAGESVLDIGTTPDCERLDSNCMIPWYQALELKVSLYSPESIAHLQQVFGDVAILGIDQSKPRSIPANDRSFSWATSSAVLEHVGAIEQQAAFLVECARVSNGIFLTTPNRFHWLEFHTKLPLMHWLPKKLHRRCLKALGLHFWAQESNLNLTSRKVLISLANRVLDAEFDWRIDTIWTLGMPSNFVLLAKRK